jgi:hypothetical protein
MTTGQLIQELANLSLTKPPIPVGSPFGFNEQDWETVSLWKAQKMSFTLYLAANLTLPIVSTRS